jgi:hypothetical protein
MNSEPASAPSGLKTENSSATCSALLPMLFSQILLNANGALYHAVPIATFAMAAAKTAR